MTAAADNLRELAQRGVGFDMNPTMLFTTAESMYSQWLDYFTRLDQTWRERVAAAADALSTPPADDVREALVDAMVLVEVSNGMVEFADDEDDRADARHLADAILARFEVRPRGTVTDAEGQWGETFTRLIVAIGDLDRGNAAAAIMREFDVTPKREADPKYVVRQCADCHHEPHGIRMLCINRFCGCRNEGRTR